MQETRQIPTAGEVFLDHLAHFLPNMAAAETVLAAMGFTLTPFTVQRNQTEAGYVPSGTANRCAMLESGYLEFLTRNSDTALAKQLDDALKRYTGVHLLAMSTDDAEQAVARLDQAGFAPAPVVHLTRAVDLPAGDEALARFSVVRVPPGTMPEGRIQLLTHHTPEIVWQNRWTAHRNGIRSLEATLLIVDDPVEVAARYGRFLGREPVSLSGDRRLLSLDRGALVFATMAEGLGGGDVAQRPWIAGYALGADDPAAAADALCQGGARRLADADPAEPVVEFPPAVGGRVVLVRPGSRPAFAR